VTVILLAAGALFFAACGDDEEESADTTTPTTPAQTSTQTEPPSAAAKAGESEGGDLKDLKRKPAVKVPGGEPPTELQSEDIVKGKGKAARSGDTVAVQYVGVLFDGAQEFDASWDRGEPFEFQLGAGMVIAGWDQGVEGMKVGGRRKLTIPSDLAYGPQGQPPTIPPGATLVFVIDLKKVS
jgi:peptidylprolyl isomerase